MLIAPEYTSAQRPNYGVLNYDDPYPEGALIKTTLFCTEERKRNGQCFYFEDPPEESLLNATVTVARMNHGSPSACSGTVIRLIKGRQSCKVPLLLTSAHCVDLSEISTKIVTAVNHKGAAHIDLIEIEKFQGRCVEGSTKNCLVPPLDKIEDSNLGYTGVDQALIPLKKEYFNKDYADGFISGYELNLDEISTRKDKDVFQTCFDQKKPATMSAILRPHHFEGALKRTSPTKIQDRIRKDTCRNLIWMGTTTTTETIKHYITHDCPSLEGLSGSLITLSCNNKKGIFVVDAQRFGGISAETEKRAEDGETMTFNPNNQSFVNTAVHIDKDLLELFSDNYCGFDI